MKFAIFFENLDYPTSERGTFEFFDTMTEFKAILANRCENPSCWVPDETIQKYDINKDITNFFKGLTINEIAPTLDIGKCPNMTWNVPFVGKTELLATSLDDFCKDVRGAFRKGGNGKASKNLSVLKHKARKNIYITDVLRNIKRADIKNQELYRPILDEKDLELFLKFINEWV